MYDTPGSVQHTRILTTDKFNQLTMVCCEAVDDVQVVPECFLILGANQHWPDLTLALTQNAEVNFSQEQVVRRNLTGYWKT